MSNAAERAPEPIPVHELAFEAGRYEEALAGWRAAVAAEPDALRPRARVAACLLALGRYAEALDVAERLALDAPDHPAVLVRLAAARAGTGRTDGALEALDRAASAGARLAMGVDDEPAFDAIRDDDRFAALRARIAARDAATAADARFRSFDFWVGDWEARTPDGVLQGHNRIERVLGGAALVERWTGLSGYRGTSLNRFDRDAGAWRQTWVDDQGDIVEFVDGVAADGRVVFQAKVRDGLRRLTFEDRGPDAFRQLSEQSDDDGRTWTVEYDFRYRRIAAQPARQQAGSGPASAADLPATGRAAAAGRSPARRARR